MALLKVCDNCGEPLGGDKFFVQSKGTVSDQHEPGGGEVSFRYLTNSREEIHTFCDDQCEMDWRDEQRKHRRFINRS